MNFQHIMSKYISIAQLESKELVGLNMMTFSRILLNVGAKHVPKCFIYY